MSETQSRPRERFVLLDGLRGVAAVFIVQRHAEPMLGDALPSSYLGVDLFFALSGFVLAHAYGAALASGRMSALAFMKARLLRLYPLYLVALALTVGYYLRMYQSGLPVMADEVVTAGELAAGVATGLLFLPTPFTISFNAALFLVHPAWSLFDELVANFAYALRGVRMRSRHIAVVIAISAAILVIAALQFERLHAGFRWHEMYAGLARVFFSFSAGVLIYRYRRKTQTPQPIAALACLAITAAVLAAPTPKDAKWIFDLIVVLFVWPALLYAASGILPDRRTSAVSTFLGTASYGLYVLHSPFIDWAVLGWATWTGNSIADLPYAPLAGIGFIGLCVLLSWWLTVAFDEPLQRRFKHARKDTRPLTDNPGGP
ncbi:peptidoglycan/LPS O-acetylase OafA/YrhL [Neorhizobium huautlense]|uniref:Peptidoglycan/LPS O-acetylase OafA/YrhL n=1 Tax=Neorhizobium huautlense TaxID=67774 RepID=A0ABT9PYQ3_9HYPH|nr:acyltransferase [Neorhizobium huautlense]MDP9839621.1 peptidoglycan/LPS O-acetylase OafA/YrhL [Neorhizobium huautlense]